MLDNNLNLKIRILIKGICIAISVNNSAEMLPHLVARLEKVLKHLGAMMARSFELELKMYSSIEKFSTWMQLFGCGEEIPSAA